MRNDEYFMNLALEEAEKAFSLGEVPVGAIIVNNLTHEVIAKAHNLKETNQKVTAHAEMLAIDEANRINNSRRLENHTLYVTLEPCSMCASAIIQSRIDRVVIGTVEPKTGALGSVIDLTKDFKTNITIKTGVLKEKCEELLFSFFIYVRLVLIDKIVQ